jgi:3-oxoacyl-[acyl-carrier-protein] synthase-1
MFEKQIYIGDAHIVSPYGIGCEINVESYLNGSLAYSNLKENLLGSDFPIKKAGIIDRDLIRDSSYDFKAEAYLNFLFNSSSISKNDKFDAIIFQFKNGSYLESILKNKIPKTDYSSAYDVLGFNKIKVDKSEIYIIDNTCVTGASLISIASQGIEIGKWNRVLVAAVDLLESRELFSLYRLGAINNNADAVVAPFDDRRKGFIKTESLSLCVLDKNKNNFSSPAILKIKSFCHLNEAYRITESAENSIVAENVMKQAIEKSKIGLSNIGFVKAHGTGTWMNDLSEGKALNKVFPNKIHVTSLKGNLGHTTDASGLIENLLLGHMLKANNVIPQTGNYQSSALQINLVKDLKYANDVEFFLANSFGFGGNNHSIVFERL